ncbi:MAG: hypothetical protein ABI383_09770 [Acidobacteriaceae bacterium]
MGKKSSAGSTSQDAVMHLVASVPIPGVKGDFDHLAYGLKGNRLFLAAEDHKSVEVFDLNSGKHLQSVAGFETPHQILYVPETNNLLVTDSGAEDAKEGYVRVISGESYKVADSNQGAGSGRFERL